MERAKLIAVGVDIGGSHISSAVVDMRTRKTVPGTYFRGTVNSKATKEIILKTWGNIINKTLATIETNGTLRIGIGFAMPGPFQYKTGMAMFQRNDKYESLYQVSVASELRQFLNLKNISLKFLNDASAFGVGGALSKKIGNGERTIALTLGTGFGAAFLKNHIPLAEGGNIPEGGCLWNKPFRNGIADDYFSTRWFISRYEELTGNKNIIGVKEIVAVKNEITAKIFEEFTLNLSEFMLPYLIKFDADLLIIGGNIIKSHQLFLPALTQKWKQKKIDLPVAIMENTEEASIIGSSYLFNENFWAQIKDELPGL